MNNAFIVKIDSRYLTAEYVVESSDDVKVVKEQIDYAYKQHTKRASATPPPKPQSIIERAEKMISEGSRPI